ncbi:hypothetical protein EV213_10688 [Aureibacillus halotolerans]|uniref:Uncharacterized protein n=1 Tax=Aureibacillus halotolerans TaxID=1508390 RepID=A0A4R6U4F8_9BACI|nr:hypothetical protein EV213_10688 [Aureibacillus halotolerans]
MMNQQLPVRLKIQPYREYFCADVLHLSDKNDGLLFYPIVRSWLSLEKRDVDGPKKAKVL